MRSFQYPWQSARITLLALVMTAGSGLLGCGEMSAEADAAVSEGQHLRLADQAPAELGTEPHQGLAGPGWRSARSMNEARHTHTATLLLSGKVLVVAGQRLSNYLSSAELYDPATDTWTPTGSLNHGRTSYTATLLPGGQVLVVGGYGSAGRLASAELYDPRAGTWTLKASLNTARNYHTTTVLPSGQVLVAGVTAQVG